MKMTGDRVLLLFCHGIGAHKEVWRPILRRLQASVTTAFPTLRVDFLAIDWRYHGDHRHTRSDADESKDTVRKLDHPLRNWTDWAPSDLYSLVRRIRREDTAQGRRKTHIIGVGHAMGSTSMLLTEIHNPGTFAGIVAFEPLGFADSARELHEVMRLMLRRPDHWPSLEDAMHYFSTDNVYRHWGAESLAAFVEGLRPSGSGVGAVRLALSTTSEFSSYSPAPFRFTDADCEQMQCPVGIEHGSESSVFQLQRPEEIFNERHGVVVGQPIPEAGHYVILDNPRVCAARILGHLKHMLDHAMLHHPLDVHASNNAALTAIVPSRL